jgi:hypothetical protein
MPDVFQPLPVSPALLIPTFSQCLQQVFDSAF